MDRERIPGDVCRDGLPDHRDLALFVARLFERLGGACEIDEAGRRHAHRPQRGELRHQGLPQLPEAKPWERFASPAEWEGAMKLAEYWLNRLSGADREYVFTLLAATPCDRPEAFDFRDRI
jgi:hypothetical protein